MASGEASGLGTGIGLALASMVLLQLGAALSEPLFDRVGPGGVVALRLVAAALILWPLARPRLTHRSRADLRAAVGLGVCSGVLTFAFFQSIDRIPLGVTVTVEFLGPLSVALVASRRPRDVVFVALAGAGVALLTLGHGAGGPLDPVGVAFAGLSATCWAGYIVLTKRVGAAWPGFEGLAVSMAVSAVVVLPVGVIEGGSELLEPEILIACAGLALLLPLIPYACELVSLRRLPTGLFGVIMSLEPAIAALLGFALLSQSLTATGVAAVAMVVIASAGATLSAAVIEQPDEATVSV
jgi:inner membrane transporter RhtA